MQRFIFGTVLFFYIWTTPQTVYNFVERRGKEEILRNLPPPPTVQPFCQSLLPDLYLLLRCPPNRSQQGGRGSNLREVAFFQRSVLPLVLVGEIWTHINHGKLVFQKNLKKKFILIPKIHPRTCPTISTQCAE